MGFTKRYWEEEAAEFGSMVSEYDDEGPSPREYPTSVKKQVSMTVSLPGNVTINNSLFNTTETKVTKSFYIVSALRADSGSLGQLKRLDTEKEAIDHAKYVSERRQAEGKPMMDI